MSTERADVDLVSAGLAGAVEVMDRLWSFGGWEVTQTHDSLRPYLLEETYELLDAIGHGDTETIKEELGDLLLQVLFHSRIAEAAGEFTVHDVAAALVAKLVNRSPHLVGAAIDPGATREEKIAAQERAWQERKSAEKTRRSCLDGIAPAQPALALAEKVVARSRAAGLPDDLVPGELRVVDALELHHVAQRQVEAEREDQRGDERDDQLALGVQPRHLVVDDGHADGVGAGRDIAVSHGSTPL
ncbi:MazG family protein [Nocardia farcinica]|uniref:MazG family protein n=1 Tax=Nocardia farcinica TaxID=37329 RepID=UPI002458F678|nr:MazG family protein [Nocardia farcinica]